MSYSYLLTEYDPSASGRSSEEDYVTNVRLLQDDVRASLRAGHQ
jgi:hypothetical protein